jgi:hypothetical protein
MAITKTLDTIAYSIIDAVRPILKRTDFIDIRDLREWVKDERNELAKQQVDKNSPFIPKEFLQTEVVNLTRLPNFNKYPDIVAVKSDNLTGILNSIGGKPMIDSISYKDFFIDKIHFIENPNSLVNYVNADRFDKQAIYSTIMDGEIVIAGRDSIFVGSLSEVKITAVFSSPESVSTFDVEFEEYPIVQNLIPILTRKITQEKYSIGLANYYDRTNDEKHNLKNESPENV